MRTLKAFILSASLIAAPMALHAAGTMPATASQPATATASDPKAAVKSLILAVFDDDEKQVLALLYLPSDQSRKEAQATLGRSTAQDQFEKALDAQFKLPAQMNELNQSARDESLKELEKAEATIDGDTAVVKVGPPGGITLVRDKGQWKIDFDKSQRAMEGPYDKEKVAASISQAQIYRAMAAEVKDNKYKTREDAQREVASRLDKIAAAQTAPAADTPRVAESRRLAAIAQISALKMVVETFETDNGRFPTTEEGLDSLAVRPANIGNFWHQYLEEIPKDPWGNPFIYKSKGDDFDLSSAGPDGKPGTADDITRDTKP